MSPFKNWNNVNEVGLPIMNSIDESSMPKLSNVVVKVIESVPLTIWPIHGFIIRVNKCYLIWN
jgi:hypothetical protein